MKTLGTKISEYRKLKQMTQEDLAIKLNVTSQAVSKWENDLSIPDLPILIELSDLFQVTLDELIRQKEVTAVAKVVEEPLRKPIEQMMLRVVVDSVKGDKVRCNIPLSLVKIGLELGMSMPEVNGNDVLKNVDLNQILALVDQGLIGKIVEVESSDGDRVEVFVE